MHYRGGLVAKTLLHRDFLKNYKKASPCPGQDTILSGVDITPGLAGLCSPSPIPEMPHLFMELAL